MHRTTWRPPVKPPVGAAEINWAHPLAHGLDVDLEMNEGAGPPIDLTGHTTWTIGGGAVPFELGLDGLQRSVVGDGSNWLTATVEFRPIDAPIVATVELRVLSGLVDSNLHAPWRGSGSSFSCYQWANNFWTAYSDTSDVVQDTSAAVVAGRLYTVVVRATGSVVSLHVDGRLRNSKVSSVGNGVSQLMRLTTTIAGQGFTGSYVRWRKWDRALDDAEILALYRDPSAFLRPVVRRRYFVAAGGPAGDVEQVGLALAGMA